MRKGIVKFLKWLRENIFAVIFILLSAISAYVAYALCMSVGDPPGRIQAVTNIVMMLSVLFVGYQAFMYKKDYKVKNKKDEVDKAIQMAEMYINEVIHNISYLLYVYGELGITKLVSDIKNSKMCQFDREELDELMDQSKQEEITKKLVSIDPAILIQARQFFCSKSYGDSLDKFAEQSVPDEHKIPKERISAALNLEFRNVKEDTLNKLEYFCMYFNSRIADDFVVYQSLHQTFLKSIKILYHDIARLNTSGIDKYYINIINLFNRWNKLYIEAHNREIKEKRSHIIDGIKIDV